MWLQKLYAAIRHKQPKQGGSGSNTEKEEERDGARGKRVFAGNMLCFYLHV